MVGLSALLTALSGASCSDDRFVEGLVIDNPTAFTASVDIADGTASGWLSLTTVEAGSETTVEEVLDQGSRWVFRFSYSGYAEEIVVSRSDLARSGWRVEVPEGFAAALHDRGVSPPP
jgi:hypothetical protein